MTYEIGTTEAYKLDKGRCRVWGCGKVDVELHHVIPRSQAIKAFKHQHENLMCLCTEHHRKVTNKGITMLSILKSLVNLPDFRWHTALQWHIDREDLRNW